MSESQVYVYIQLPETLEAVPAALLKVTRHDGTYIGRFRYGDRYLERNNAVELDPYQLPLSKDVYEFTKLKGIPGAVRDAAPDAWGRRVIEHKLQRGPADLEEIDYLLGLDRARMRLRNEIDWPGQSLDLFINLVRQAGGTLSQTKRRSQFNWMKDEEIQRFVPMVNEAFEMNGELESGEDP